MNMTRDRVQSLAWALIISVSFALLLALTFRVNAVKSQVRLLDRRIVALKQEKTLLETEFQTRANQQQLAALNDVDFGFKAPTAGQYIEGEQQLASMSKPAAPDAPAPILMASAEVPTGSRPAAGTLPAVFTASASKSLAMGPATRMLAQHGERVAPVGQGKLEQKLALAGAQPPAPRKSALAAANAEKKLGGISGTERVAKAAGSEPSGRARDVSPVHGTPALAAVTRRVRSAPAAASLDFLAAATGNDRLRAAGASTAAAKPGRHAQTVADAFGGDWERQIPGSAKAAKDPASTGGKAKPGRRRVAIEDAARVPSQ